MGRKKREKFRKEGQRLVDAISTHTEAVIDAVAADMAADVIRYGEGLRKALLRYADAQFDVANMSHPFGPLYDEPDFADSDRDLPGERISVVLRLDFVSNLNDADQQDELPTVLVGRTRQAMLDLCEAMPDVSPVAILTAAVRVQEDSDLAGLRPMPDSEELLRVLGAVDRVDFSELDLY